MSDHEHTFIDVKLIILEIEKLVNDSVDEVHFNQAVRFKSLSKKLMDIIQLSHPNLHGNSLDDAWLGYIGIHNRTFHNGIATGALSIIVLIDEVIEYRKGCSEHDLKRFLYDVAMGWQGLGFELMHVESHQLLPTLAVSDFNINVLR